MNPCIASYFELCRPFVMPAPWQCCEPDDQSFAGPADPLQAIIWLAQRHTKEQLLAGGIACLDSEGRLAMHPMLAEPDVVFVALKNSMTGELINLMTNGGCVFGTAAPVFEVLGDKHAFPVLSGNDRAVFVTDTIVGTVLLRSFGMVAAPIAGLGRLNRDGVQLLCDYYGVRRNLSEREQEDESLRDETGEQRAQSTPETAGPLPGRERQAESTSTASDAVPTLPRYLFPGTGSLGTDRARFVQLTLVRWSPQRLSMTEAPLIKQVIEDLIALKRHRRLDISEISHWIPKDDDLASLQFALKRGEPEWIKAALLDSVYAGVNSLERPNAASRTLNTPPQDLPGAIEYLHEALLGVGDEKSRQRCKEARQNYRRVIDRCITAPMLRQAEAAAEPLDGALLLQFTQLNALFLEKGPEVRAQILQRPMPTSGEPVKNDGDKAISELLAISGQLVLLAKEMMKWKPRSTPVLRHPPMPQFKHSPRFADSDLARKN